MRILRLSIVLLTLLSLVAFGYCLVYEKAHTVAPEITCRDGKEMAVSGTVTDAELLSHVIAYDREDGDLSSSVVVERKSYFLEPGVCPVTFAVCDSDGNVSKLSCTLRYLDYHAPFIRATDDLIVPAQKDSIDFTALLKVEDAIEGDISSRLKIISTDYTSANPGAYTVNAKVNNTYGDSRDISFNVYVTKNDFPVTITLADYITYVPKGGTPDYTGLITAVSNGYSADNITVDSSRVNTQIPGVYDVLYDLYSRGETIGHTRLIVVVEEGN